MLIRRYYTNGLYTSTVQDYAEKLKPTKLYMYKYYIIIVFNYYVNIGRLTIIIYLAIRI